MAVRWGKTLTNNYFMHRLRISNPRDCMKKNVMLTTCMIAMTMCLSFSQLTAADAPKEVQPPEMGGMGLAKPDPKLREAVDRQNAIQEYEAKITDVVKNKKGPEEEQKAEIAKIVDAKTQEVYKYQGEPTEEIKQQMLTDKAAKDALDNTPGSAAEKWFAATDAYNNQVQLLSSPITEERAQPSSDAPATEDADAATGSDAPPTDTLVTPPAEKSESSDSL